MAKRASRVQKAEEAQTTPYIIEMLLFTLNGDFPEWKGFDETDSKKLLQFVYGFQHLWRLLDGYRVKRNPNVLAYSTTQIDAAVDALNELFAGYLLTPILSPSLGFLGRGHNWRLAWKNPQELFPSSEFRLVLALEELANEGRILSLRQCAHCGRWLFAKFSHQRFCKDSCRDSFHRSNPEDKSRRRDWARKNYQLHQTKNVK